MYYLIDGHNLIPKLAGFSLRQLDDETELIDVLQSYCRIHRTKLEVYFDKAPPGYSGTRRFGLVTAHFVPHYMTADAAIIKRMLKLKKSSGSYTVVTSDRQIQAEARACGVKIITSEEFASAVQQAYLDEGVQNSNDNGELSDEEVEEWLKLFSDRNDQRKNNS